MAHLAKPITRFEGTAYIHHRPDVILFGWCQSAPYVVGLSCELVPLAEQGATNAFKRFECCLFQFSYGEARNYPG